VSLNVTRVGTLYVSTGFGGTKRLPPSLILVRVQNHSLLDAFTFPLIFFIIANFHNKLKRQQNFRYFIFNRF
jgi:hypothetical protein